MEPDFFKDLEDSFCNVGADELWTETIGGRKIWFTPIPFAGQAKVQESLSSNDLGTNVINETKRITLSHAIVGIDNVDLRPYRNAGQVFGPLDFPGGKKFKVDLPTYIYMKMSGWGQQFLDDCFNVFADRMDTHGKQNVKDIKFENSKNPADELGELMVRVTELRIQLGLPELIEKSVSPTEDEAQAFTEITRSQLNDEDSVPPPTPSTPVESFDPFKTVQITPPPKPSVRSPAAQQSFIPPTPSAPPPVPVNTLPVPVPPTNTSNPGASRAQQLAQLEGHTSESSPQNPFVATPSVESSVIERSQREVAGQIVTPTIDPIQYGRNPRFNPPRGG